MLGKLGSFAKLNLTFEPCPVVSILPEPDIDDVPVRFKLPAELIVPPKDTEVLPIVILELAKFAFVIPAVPDKSEFVKFDTFKVTVFPVTVDDTEPVPNIDNVSPKFTTSVVDVLSLIVIPELTSEELAMFDIEFREELIVLLVIVCDWSVDKKSVPLNAELNSVNVPESVLLVKLIIT